MLTEIQISTVFGPVPSRRLGRSLGINNIPPKYCSYACVYCQIGRTIKLRISRDAYYQTNSIVKIIDRKLEDLKIQNETVDYLAFVPDGEPTLDINLGMHINSLKRFNVPVAVISNASLINIPCVQEDLMVADWVSVKIDSVNEAVWKRINRPHGSLNLQKILEGMIIFREKFKGRLVSETMLIKDLNDSETDAVEMGNFLKSLNPDIAYLSIPTRPPAERNIQPAEPDTVNKFWQIISSQVRSIELLTGYEGNAFSSTGDLRKDMLSITSVHPMREDAVERMLSDYNENYQFIEQMIKNNELIKSDYKNHTFYLRKF
ncbi:MAG: radical SAM protein [Calditrichaceae bacterium]|nr:radical SAM protein [Calditrichaceae bacterium]